MTSTHKNRLFFSLLGIKKEMEKKDEQEVEMHNLSKAQILLKILATQKMVLKLANREAPTKSYSIYVRSECVRA